MKSALTHLIKISVASIEGCFSNLPKLKNTMTSEVTSNFLFQMTFLQKHNVAKEKLILNWELIIIATFNFCNIWTVHRIALQNHQDYFNMTRIYGHLRWPFFSPFGDGKVLELVSNCKSLNNLEGMTIFENNDTNVERMTIIWKEWQWSGRNDNNLEGMTIIRKEWQ